MGTQGFLLFREARGHYDEPYRGTLEIEADLVRRCLDTSSRRRKGDRFIFPLWQVITCHEMTQ